MLSALLLTCLLGSALSHGKGSSSDSSDSGSGCKCKSEAAYGAQQALLKLRYALDDAVLGLITGDELEAEAAGLLTDDFVFVYDYGSSGTITGGKTEFLASLPYLLDNIKDYRFSYTGGFYYQALTPDAATVRENLLNISPQVIDSSSPDTCRQDNTGQRVVYDLERDGSSWKINHLLLANIHNLVPPETIVDC